MKWPRHICNQAGATLVEVLVAIAITGIMLPALATALVSSHAGRPTSTQQLEATSLLREATEAVRSVREAGWSGIATNGIYHPVISGNAWTLMSGNETVNGFTRAIVISDALRDGSGNLVSTGGVVDPLTKHIAVTVVWSTPSNASVSSDTYLARWQQDAAWTQSTLTDFGAGARSNTSLTSSGDGEVQLSDTPTTWQLPSVLANFKISTGLAANDVFVRGNYAYVGYNGGLAIVDVSDPAAPLLKGTYPTFTVHVHRVFVSGNIAYLATDNSVGQLEMIDISNPAAPTLSGAFQILDTAEVAATSVYVSGTTAYVCKKQVTTGGPSTKYGEFNIVNVANPALPSLIGSLNIGADCNGLTIHGTTAYLATSAGSKQLAVVDISNETNPVLLHTTNLGVDANDISSNGTSLYVVTKNNAAGPEFRAYDISTPGTPAPTGSYEVGADVGGVSLQANVANLATSRVGKQFIALDLTAPNTPALISSVGLAANAHNVFTLGNYAYIASADPAKGLAIIYGGFRPSGTFESSSFDATKSVGFNYLQVAATVPTGTTFKFQIATNTDDTSWNYVGPDGTGTTYFTTSNAIPYNSAVGRYFRYKAYFTPSSNGQQTPILTKVTLNYVP